MASSVGSRLPGITVDIRPDVSLIQPLGFERFPCIMGIGDQELVSRQNFLITRGSGADDPLPETIQQIYRIGRAPGISEYTGIGAHQVHPGTDFTIVAGTNSAGKPISIVRWAGTATNPAQPATGKNYWLSWTVPIPSKNFSPRLILNPNDVERLYGFTVMFSDHTLINPLVVAAKVAFGQGTPGCYLVQLDSRGEHGAIVQGASAGWVNPLDPTGLELDDSYEAAKYEIDKIEEFKIWVVPLDPVNYPESLDPRTLEFPNGHRAMNTDNNSRFFLHVLQASSVDEGRERTLIGNAPQGTELEELLNLAQTFRETAGSDPNGVGGGYRFAIPGVKGELTDDNSSVDVSVYGVPTAIVPVSFLSAAVAGMMSAAPIGTPHNSEAIGNISLLGDWSINEARILRGGGVMPFKFKQSFSTGGGLTTCVFPITCDTTSAFTEDLSVQDIADYLKAYVRIKLFDAYRNVKITASTTGAIETTLKSILDTLIGLNILVSYDNDSIHAEQDKSEPRLITVTGTCKPAFPLRWIDVQLTFSGNI